ncbi:DUF7691 family protein [Streptomyces sp. NPDC002851]
MSSGLTVHLLDLNATRAIIGSRDEQLLEVIRTNFSDQLDHDDDWFSSEIEDGAPTAYEALRTVVNGGPFSDNEDHAFQYAYAYKLLCSLTGAFLNNSCFSPFKGDWLSVVDQGLRDLRITAVSLEDFWLGSLPQELPRTHIPSSGEWTPEQITRALQQFEETKAADHAPPLEPEVVDAVMQCLNWMRHAEQQPGFGIIGFVS